jgi:hypothetical protein
MFVIWSGRGLLTIPVAALSGGLGMLPVGVLVPGNSQAKLMAAVATGCMVAAMANYFLSKLLSKTDPPRTYIDPVTREQYVARRRDTLFFIPVRLWTWIMAAYALWLVVDSLHLAGYV